jgi:predicted transcriptional regulator
MLQEKDVLYVRSLYGKQQGKVLAEELGVSPAAISAAQRGRTWGHLESVETMQNITLKQRLSPEQIAYIRTQRGAQTAKEVAQMLGVSDAAVYRVWARLEKMSCHEYRRRARLSQPLS